MSGKYASGKTHRQIFLDIDAAAGTPLTYFDGDLAPLEFLKYDITNLAHYIRKDSDVLVVGPERTA